MAEPRPELRPDAGFCIQTDSLGTPAGRWYLNMTRHRIVEMPVAHSGKIISREFILQHGIGSMKIPFDMGSFRKLKERAEGHKQTAYCVDVVFNPFIIQMFMDDDFNNTMKEYRPFIINLALQRIESSIGVKLSTQKVKLIKKFLYKDGEGNSCQTPKEFTDLPQEIETTDEVQPPPKPPAEEKPEEPLIQDVTKNKKPAIKKGFFKNATTALYPEGSKEGVVPENAGDPMGWMPKKLRQTCKIVDTNSPEYQETERKKKAAEEHNGMNKEFSDMLQADMGKWNKTGSQWNQDDLPDGAEDQPTQKYEVDYSRFDKVADVDDKPEKEDRDWYYDNKGNRHSHSSSKPTTAVPDSETTQAESGPAMKKGFLDNAKSPLYPKGSEQRAPPDEADLMKKAEGMFGGDEAAMMKSLGLDDMPDMSDFRKAVAGNMPEPNFAPESRAPGAQKPNVAAKVPERKTPEFKLDCDDTEGLLQLVVEVPGLTSMQGVDLDVTEKSASLIFPSNVALKPLKVELPAEVIPSSVKAKFSKKTSQLTVKLPLLLKVAKAG